MGREMSNTFPIIDDIEQVREAIKDRPEFIEAVRDDYIVFNYMVAHEDSFDCPIRRECRGLIFSKNGKVLSRRFSKFFNLGEKEYTQPHNIDWNRPHVVLEKLDGSMVSPLIINGEVRWATKMGITDISAYVEGFVKQSQARYNDFAWLCHQHGFTPIFEFMSPMNRVVLPHAESRMVLLAIRANVLGYYLDVATVRANACRYDIPVVDIYIGSLDDLKNQTDMEGVVVRFDDGEMIKIKTDWYVAIHKAKENILHEKNVIRLILEDKIDDIIPNLPETDQQRLLDFKERMLHNIDVEALAIANDLAQIHYNNVSRKQYATEYANKINPFSRSIVFASWEDYKIGKIRDRIIQQILKNCGSQKAVDSIRHIIKVEWKVTGEL
jgi:RNA ligase